MSTLMVDNIEDVAARLRTMPLVLASVDRCKVAEMVADAQRIPGCSIGTGAGTLELCRRYREKALIDHRLGDDVLDAQLYFILTNRSHG